MTLFNLKLDKKRVLNKTIIICLLIINFVFSLNVCAANYFTFTYRVTLLNEIEITGYNTYNIKGDVVIPDVIDGYPVTKIERLSYSDKITSIYVPKSVTTIANMTFNGCDSLKKITIPFIGGGRGGENGVASVFGWIFDWTLGSTAQEYRPGSYTRCEIPSSLREVVVTDETFVPYGAFSNCKNLTNITLSDSVASIGDRAFYYCEGLESFTVPKSVEHIGEYAFFLCYNMKSIYIPDNVKSIGNSAFGSCFGIKDVYYSGSEEDWKNIEIGEKNENLTNATIHYNSQYSTTQITNLTVDESGNVNLAIINAPYGAKTYLATYDNDNKMKDVKSLILTNGAAKTNVSLDNILKIKVFLWDEHLFLPLCDLKKYILSKQ